MKLNELEQIYETIRKKHQLPSFKDINAKFDIGKIKRDSGNLLREIRHVMNEKISYFMRLIEAMINPSQAPPTFMILVKEINKEDKKLLDSLFSSFMNLELESYRLNIESTEFEESKFIEKIWKVWNENQPNLNKIIDILERNWNKTSTIPKQNKGYFN